MSSQPKYPVQEDYEKDSMDHIENSDQLPTVHTDTEQVPLGYWRSYKFIGSVVAIILLANSLFIGYVMPVSTVAPTRRE
jgi:hypothetical protein